MNKLVIGVGNIIMADDGVGIRVIEVLAKENLPSNLTLIDAGTSLIDSFEYFLNYEDIIIIDSLIGGHTPGTIYKLTPEQVNNYNRSFISIHDVGLVDLIKLANSLGKYPKVTIIGIEPKIIELSQDLSPEIETVISDIVTIVNKMIL